MFGEDGMDQTLVEYLFKNILFHCVGQETHFFFFFSIHLLVLYGF